MIRRIPELLFLVFSAWHLWESWREDPVGRARSKPFPILLLALSVLFAPRPDLLLAAALLTSWLGDVLLIPKGHGWFAAGGVSFLFSHLLFIAVYLPRIDPMRQPWALIAAAALLYCAVALRVILAVRDNTPKLMLPPMYLYLLANSAMNTAALMQLFSLRTPGALAAWAGALLFFASDCCLFLVRYHPRRDLVPKKHFPVMLLYLLGEFLIARGIQTLP